MPDDPPASEVASEAEDCSPPHRSLLLPLGLALAGGVLLTALLLAGAVVHRSRQPSAPAVQVGQQPPQRVAPAARPLGAAAHTGFTLLAETVYVLIVVVVVGGLTWLIIWLIIWLCSSGTACPVCRKRWAKVLVSEKVLERKKCYGLVTRSAYSSSWGSYSGSSDSPGSRHATSHHGTVGSSGITSWQERVPVIRTTYLRDYTCKYCQAEWSETDVEEEEDFDIERE